MPRTDAAYIRDASQSYVNQLWERRDFALFMAWGNIRSAHATTVLGVIWWVLNPLLLALVYLLVFGVILNTSRGQPDYLAYLVSGMFVFYYTRQAANSGATSITKNVRLLANLNIPKLILPISSLIQAMIGFGLSIVVAVVLNASYASIWPSLGMLYLIPAFILQTLFNLGLAALFARWAMSVADVTQALPYLLRIWLYMSPIIWPLAQLEQQANIVQWLMKANPMYPFIGMYRTALLGYPFEMAHLVAGAAWAVVMLVAGLAIFIRSESTILRGI